MVERSVKQLTLREMFTDADRLTRDLVDHLDKGFIPKVQELLGLVRPTGEQPYDPLVEDITVRHHAARVLEGEDFTDQLYEKLSAYFRGIDRTIAGILGEDVE